ncbi:hypothetical protein V1293_000031 [Bradyrhizobium sp. AZCC 1693]
MCVRVLATHCARDLLKSLSLKREGTGNAGCLLHPRSRVQYAEKCAHEHTGTAGALRHSLRNGLTAYAALSLETNSSCLHHCRLDGSIDPVGSTSPPAAWHQPRVSGPHGFAVRVSAVRLAHRLPLMRFNPPCDHLVRRRCRVHHIPPRVRDDRDTPLLSRRDSAEIATDLGSIKSGKFLQGRLDDPNQIESVQQIRFCAHCFSSAVARAGERTHSQYVVRGLGLMRCPRQDDMIDWAMKRWPAEMAAC